MHKLFDDFGTGIAEFVRAARGSYLAVGYQVTAICDHGDFLHVVAHQDAGDAKSVIHLPDQPHDDAHRNRIQADEWLVIDKNVRIHDHRPRQRDTARHAAR